MNFFHFRTLGRTFFVDIELLNACRTEFHRRLRVYNQWRERSQNNGVGANGQRAPDFVFTNGSLPFIFKNVLR